MAEYAIEQAYEILMSPAPYSQASASAMIRNFGAAAALMADHLRSGAAQTQNAGSAGAAAQDQAHQHAVWFDQVAGNSQHAATQLDTLVATGNEHQATAASVHASFAVTKARASGPTPSDQDQIAMLHQSSQGSDTLTVAVNDWGQHYSGFTAPTAPPVPHSAGAGGAGAGGAGAGGAGAGGAGPVADGGGSGTGAAGSHGNDPGGSGGALFAAGAASQLDRGPGVPGSIEVGPSGGEFAGWYHDPRTGYYVDPGTGREFDPVSNRWVDPVTGQPFGDVTSYATGLQSVGPASTTTGLLSPGAASIGAAGLGGSAAGLAGGGAGSAVSFGDLFSSGAAGATAVSGAYGGVLPPSLGTGSSGVASLWTQAGRNLEVKQQAAASLLAREQAARAGRPYLPPTQAQGGAGGGKERGRARPGYLTAELDESLLFTSPAGATTGVLGD